MLNPLSIRYFFNGKKLARFRGVAQLVARLVRDQEVVGSNPVTPTRNKKKVETNHFLFVCVAKATRFEPRFNPLAGDGNPFVNFRLTFPLIGESPVTPTNKKE